MGSGSTQLTGPDLALGVRFADLKEGEPLLGHAHGEPVILVRRGADAYAVGATCTHYSGPLAEGLVVGDTVRCPWHHACFDLRTGAAGAPALSPIACYEVDRQGALVVVGEKRLQPKARQRGQARASVVVIGAGAAGAAAVETLRAVGYQGSLALVGAEEPGPVDRPNLSKDYLAGNAPEEWIPLRGPAHYRDLNVEFIANDPAVAIDLGKRQVTLKSGRKGGYERLVIATGAEPVRLPIPGADLAHVHTLRTLADSRAIIARAGAGRKAVVIGASFIGLEAAAALRARGSDVEVVAPESLPLARILGEELGRYVLRLHEDHGVGFNLGRKPVSIESDGVTLDDGQRLPADVVVMGVGVRPRVALAQAAGLRCEDGILVDEYLKTGADGVYAAGDAARFPYSPLGAPVRIEHWVHAQRMGQAAARNLLGQKRPFRDAPFFWSAHYDLTLCYVGHAPRWDDIEVRGNLAERDATLVYRLAGKVAAVVTLGRDKQSLAAEAALEAGDQAALQGLLAETP